jgi:hypothetical protein
LTGELLAVWLPSTLDEDDVVHARLRTLGDGHYILTVQLGTGALLVGDPDVLAQDYEENPFPEDTAPPSH